MDISNVVGACFAMAMGLVFVLWSRTLGTRACRFQEKLLKRELSELGFQLSYLVAGIGFIGISIYVLLTEAGLWVTE